MTEENIASEHLEKVAINLRDDRYGTETLWAEPLGDGLYRLRNVPFLAYGFSEQDEVGTSEAGGRRIVTRVARPGGHSTYRVFLPNLYADLGVPTNGPIHD